MRELSRSLSRRAPRYWASQPCRARPGPSCGRPVDPGGNYTEPGIACPANPALTHRSVAWVKDAGYWQDQPGKQSMRLNYHVVRKGVAIERIVILRGALWPEGEALPAESTATPLGSSLSAPPRNVE